MRCSHSNHSWSQAPRRHVSAENADAAFARLTAAVESVARIGTIRARVGDEHQTIVV